MGSLTETSIDYTVHPRVNSHDPIPPRPRPDRPADVIRTDEDAIATATRLAADFAVGAALRTGKDSCPCRNSTLIPRAACGRSTCRKPMAAPGSPMRRSRR